MKVSALDRLERGIVLVAPLTRTFVVVTTNGKRTLSSRYNCPHTCIRAFTDYRAQTQTIEYCVVDIGTPPSGPCDAWVGSQGRDKIRLSRDFDERQTGH